MKLIRILYLNTFPSQFSVKLIGLIGLCLKSSSCLKSP